jgi:hypothetical protein
MYLKTQPGLAAPSNQSSASRSLVSGPKMKRPMVRRITMLGAGAVVSLGFFMMASPAMAQQYPGEGGSSGDISYAPTPRDDGLDATSVALGALAGITFAGVGVGVTVGVQRRREHGSMPTA